MQTKSYTYQTSAKKYEGVQVENEQLKYTVQKVKEILTHNLYKENSKIALCLEILKENGY